ncbi:LysR family transcriptional regulator [Caenimonas aquaedulcis]|uniref:LysR family transcriptional regulator n=1 Tax=Caenimonas aquaedulcis TaxID=2793270 RepID=A0A931H342_9BURK|nr:LysR family transcriptional regulator [Caenimonas aquaedulcis]MBG9387630.1 LysR family transcriptional regulator [Caenimonas aquaedulcis]
MSKDWDSDFLGALVAFGAVADAGTFSEAARRMGTSKSALSKQVQRLEERLGARLLHRTTRALSLTEPGRLALEHAEQVARSAQAARAAVASLTSEPRGLLRVTTSVAYGKAVLLPLVSEFVRSYPEVEVDLVLMDRMVDFTEERIDVAIRLVDTPPDLSIAKSLRPIHYVLVARAGSDLARRILHPSDLQDVEVLSYSRDMRDTQWTFVRNEEAVVLRMRGRVSVNNSESLATLVADGLGVAVVPDYIAQELIRRRKIISLLPDWRVKGRFGSTVWIVRPPERAVLPAVRAFTDFLVGRLGLDSA